MVQGWDQQQTIARFDHELTAPGAIAQGKPETAKSHPLAYDAKVVDPLVKRAAAEAARAEWVLFLIHRQWWPVRQKDHPPATGQADSHRSLLITAEIPHPFVQAWLLSAALRATKNHQLARSIDDLTPPFCYGNAAINLDKE